MLVHDCASPSAVRDAKNADPEYLLQEPRCCVNIDR